MIFSAALFWIVALVTVAGALGVVFSPKAIHAVLSLLVVMFGMAVGFYALGSPLLAAMQLIIYAGAVIVLFLFVVMLLDITDVLPSLNTARGVLAAVSVLGTLALTGLLVALILGGGMPAQAATRLPGTPAVVGWSLYNDHIALLLLIGILLTAAADGVVGLTRGTQTSGGKR